MALRAAAWIGRCLAGCGHQRGKEIEALAGRLEQRLLEPGGVAFAQGRMPAGVWIVRSGTLELVTGAGRERVVVGVLPACGIAGDVPLLLGRPAPYTARALTAVSAGFLPAAVFLPLLDASPAVARAWLTALASRHARAQQALAQTVGGSAEIRVARLLLREARGGTVTYAQGTLAAMLGLRRPTLNHILKGFERDGLLSIGYRQIRLLSADRLRERAHHGNA